MTNRRAPLEIVSDGFFVIIAVFTLATFSSVRAQQGSPLPGPPAGERDPFGEVRERQQREAQLRSSEMASVVRKPDHRDGEAAVEQVRQNFKNIQILRNKVVRHLLSETPLDYRFIAGETGEINKRALQLRMHLMPEKSRDEKGEQDAQVDMDGDQVKSALVKMCKRIDSFTENPIFKLPDTIDAQQSAKASRDLADIIQISGSIRRSAERLNKTHGK